MSVTSAFSAITAGADVALQLTLHRIRHVKYPPHAELTDGYSKIANTTNELAGQASVMSGGPHLIFNFAASEIYRSHTFPQTEQTPGCPVSHHTGVHDRNHVIVIQ